MEKQQAIDLLAKQGIERCSRAWGTICDNPVEHMIYAKEDIEALEKAGLTFDENS